MPRSTAMSLTGIRRPWANQRDRDEVSLGKSGNGERTIETLSGSRGGGSPQETDEPTTRRGEVQAGNPGDRRRSAALRPAARPCAGLVQTGLPPSTPDPGQRNPGGPWSRIRDHPRPVLPNPPPPLCVSEILCVSSTRGASNRANTSCAILSPRRTGNGASPTLWSRTLSSPR